MQGKILLFVCIIGCVLAQITQLPTDQKQALVDLRNANPLVSSDLQAQNGWNTTDPIDIVNATDFCTWDGVGCGDFSVQTLSFDGIRISAIPDSIFGVMRDLALFRFRNCTLTATLPANNSIGLNRITMNFFDLSNNRFSGSLPSAYMNSKMRYLYLQNNAFSGPLPDTVSTMASLWELNLANNQFSGTIPSGLANSPELSVLNLANNRFSGPIPASFATLSQLTVLDLSGNNLNGSLPDFKNCPGLREVYLQGGTNNFDTLVPSFFTTYTGVFNFTGVKFRCPIPACAPGVDCILNRIPKQCYCPCNQTGGGKCVLDTYTCECNSYRYGALCDTNCPGTIVSGSQVVPCNGHGTCNNGPTGTGKCTCFAGFGGPDCSNICPTGPNGTCSGYGSCIEGICSCTNNRGGVNCFDCHPSWAGATCDIPCRDCSGNGNCRSGLQGDGVCTCFSGFEGANCEVDNRVKSSGLGAWGIVGVILIIFFVLALAAIGVGVFFYLKKSKEYDEIESKLLESQADKEMEAFRAKRDEDENRDSVTGLQARKQAQVLQPI